MSLTEQQRRVLSKQSIGRPLTRREEKIERGAIIEQGSVRMQRIREHAQAALMLTQSIESYMYEHWDTNEGRQTIDALRKRLELIIDRTVP